MSAGLVEELRAQLAEAEQRLDGYSAMCAEQESRADELERRLSASEEERKRHAKDAVTLDAIQADIRGKLAEAERQLENARARVRILGDKIAARDEGYELLLEACRGCVKRWAEAAESASVEGGEQYAFRTCSDDLTQELRDLGERGG